MLFLEQLIKVSYFVRGRAFSLSKIIYGVGRSNLLGALGQNAGLLSSISHLLPQGTSISSILSILSLLNNVNQLNNDIHQIPVLLNQTLSTLVGGAGQATQIIVDQLIGLVTPHGKFLPLTT